MIWEGTLQLLDSWFPSGKTKAALASLVLLFVPFSADIPARKWWYISADDLWAPALMWGSKKLFQGGTVILGVGMGWPILQQNSLHKGLVSGSQLLLHSCKKRTSISFPSLGKGKGKQRKNVPLTDSTSSSLIFPCVRKSHMGMQSSSYINGQTDGKSLGRMSRTSSPG